MSLTDIVKNTAYALTASLALAGPLYSAEKPANSSNAIQQYSEEELKITDLPKEMSHTESNKTKNYFDSLKPEEKVVFKEIFTNPKGYMKRTFNKEKQEDFEDIFNIDFKEIKGFKYSRFAEGFKHVLEESLEERFPWKSDIRTLYDPKVNDNYNLSKRLWQYYKKEVKESFPNVDSKKLREDFNAIKEWEEWEKSLDLNLKKQKD